MRAFVVNGWAILTLPLLKRGTEPDCWPARPSPCLNAAPHCWEAATKHGEPNCTSGWLKIRGLECGCTNRPARTELMNSGYLAKTGIVATCSQQRTKGQMSFELNRFGTDDDLRSNQFCYEPQSFFSIHKCLISAWKSWCNFDWHESTLIGQACQPAAFLQNWRKSTASGGVQTGWTDFVLFEGDFNEIFKDLRRISKSPESQELPSLLP